MADLESLALPLFGARWKRAAARFLGVDARRVRRWASGQLDIPTWVFERLAFERARRMNEMDFSAMKTAIDAVYARADLRREIRLVARHAGREHDLPANLSAIRDESELRRILANLREVAHGA